jgi:hypothetical protein
MLFNESAVAVSVRTDRHSAVAIAPDVDFEARWAAWRARGRGHERAVGRTLTPVAGVSVVATAIAIAYMLLRA